MRFSLEKLANRKPLHIWILHQVDNVGLGVTTCFLWKKYNRHLAENGYFDYEHLPGNKWERITFLRRHEEFGGRLTD